MPRRRSVRVSGRRPHHKGYLLPKLAVEHSNEEAEESRDALLFPGGEGDLTSEKEDHQELNGFCHPPGLVHNAWCPELHFCNLYPPEGDEAQLKGFDVVFPWKGGCKSHLTVRDHLFPEVRKGAGEKLLFRRLECVLQRVRTTAV